MNQYSNLIDSLIPDFITEDHPKFVAFLKAYYEWLDNSRGGQVGYFIEKSQFNRDVDQSISEFITYFKKEYLPFFPEHVLVDERKLIKFAREFYQKKGTEDSFKFLFRVLFDKDIELFYPKQDILRTSDGKWKLPQSIRLSISTANENFDVSLLDKRKASGRESKAIARIEKAYSTVEKNTNIPIIELFVTNVDKLFQNGEIIDITYIDANGVEQTFSERLIGSISAIILDQNRKGTGYRGIERDISTGLITYTGDPVVIFGGLNDSAGAIKASANVTEVTQGSIDSVSLIHGGYGFRTYDNTYIDVVTTDGREANLRVISVDSSNSNVVYVNSDYVGLFANVILNSGSYGFTNTASGTLATQLINAFSFDPISVSPIRVVQLYNGGLGFTTKPLLDAISTYDTDRTAGGSPYVVLRQGIEIVSSTQETLTFSSSFSSDNYAYVGNRIFFGNEIRKIVDYNGSTKVVTLNRPFISSLLSGADLLLDLRPDLKDLGILAAIEIDSVGSNYSNTDTVMFVGGTGYGASANIVVNSLGEIQRVNLLDRGAGFFSAPTVTVTSGTGSGAMLSAYVYGDGETISPITGKIGQIKSITLNNRGFDYISKPYVSLKIADILTSSYPDGVTVSAGDVVYQGANVNSTTYVATVDSFNPVTGMIRVFDYSGNINLGSNVKVANTTTSTEFQATVGSVRQYPSNGAIAKAEAEFLNGLIKYKGYFLNTDGFLSADKKLQGPRKYHNFSYVVAIEQELSSYEKVVKAILHPAGTSMFGLNYVSNKEFLDPQASIEFKKSANNNGFVSIDAFSNIVVGSSGAIFTGNVSVNDILVIEPSNQYRTRVLEVDAIGEITTLNVSTNTTQLFDGRLRVTTGNANVVVSMNTSPVGSLILANDKITLNTGTYGVVSVTGNVVRLNTTTGLVSSNVLFDHTPVYSNVEYRIYRS